MRQQVYFWFGTPVLRLNALLHAVILGCWIGGLLLWSGAIASLIIWHLVLAILTLTPRCPWLGENLTRLPPKCVHDSWVALTFDDGPDPDITPQVLDILDRYQAKASFFLIGQQVLAYPALVREITSRGHSVENHSFGHLKYFSVLPPQRLLREVAQCQHVIREVTGCTPLFFRPTAGFRSPLLFPILRALNLRLATWTRRGFDTRCKEPQRVLQRLVTKLSAGDILLLHDGHAARDTQGNPIILSVLPALLEQIQAQELVPVTLANAFSNP